ncbi:MAG: NAD(P)/FAD-dependent oxidoreductase, partial [Gammaproteobacteria bacterium]
IIGAGVMGAAAAFWLTRLRPDLDVLLIERDTRFASASSSLSASGIRQQFSCAVNIRLSRFGIEFLRDAPRWLGDDGAALGLREAGYLYLATAAQADRLREAHAIQRAANADVTLLGAEEIARRFPWLHTGDIALGSLGQSGEGWFDGPALHRALLAAARRQGARLLQDEVLAWDLEAERVTALRLASGKTLHPKTVVLAAGAWSGELAARSGLTVPIHASRRSVFVLRVPEPLPDCPLIVDPSGFWLRPEGEVLITGREPATESHVLPLDPDWSEFDETQWSLLAHRIPALESLRVERAWAGYYEMNTFDHNALIGPWPGIGNLHLLAGFSGHGMQHAAGAGLALAEWLLHGLPRSIDVRELSPGRIARNAPLRELNVIG